MDTRAHLYISGIVQGVFYRAFVQDLANKFGLKGWVRNLPDRRVEAVFEGKKDSIEKAIAKCYEGPPYAHVTNIEVIWENHLEGFDSFRIIY